MAPRVLLGVPATVAITVAIASQPARNALQGFCRFLVNCFALPFGIRVQGCRPTHLGVTRDWQYLLIRYSGDVVGIRAAVEISRTTIREQAVAFAANHANDTSEQGQRQTFWYEFYQVFGGSVRQVAIFEQIARRHTTGNVGWIDLLHPGEMAIEHKSAGGDLNAAMNQLLDYTPSLPVADLPWLLVVCDFKRFAWQNLESHESGEFPLSDLPDHIDLFSWIGGYRRPGEHFENEEDANLKATELLASVHDKLVETGYPEHALRKWITRILFCLFADDTRVWERDALRTFLALHTKPDGSDLGQTLAYIFEILDTPPEQRSTTLDPDLAEFTYVNGDMFGERLPTPSCTEGIRTALLNACRFNWAAISPAIFGSLFQSVMTPIERRQLGAHYTSEENILRMIRPLFLEELERELSACTTEPKLKEFHERLSQLRFLDPACGCGNFLVVTYRELRRLEAACIERLYARQRRAGFVPQVTNLTQLCKVTVDQFYGIEIEDFPALIASTAMHLADHLANEQLSRAYGLHFARFPIPSSAHIVVGNALELDWADVVHPAEVSFVFGNPPFIGRGLMTALHRAEIERIWGAGLNSSMDYVSGWFGKCLAYLNDQDKARWGFVATNSVSQGEAVPTIWGAIRDGRWRCRFAHRSLQWRSEARGKAVVHVSIVGFDKEVKPRPQLWVHDGESGTAAAQTVPNINPYLVDGPNCIVRPRPTPISPDLPEVSFGSMPRDGGFLLLDEKEMLALKQDEVAFKYVRPFVGARELIHGERRWCLWLTDLVPGDVQSSPELTWRLEQVRRAREASKAESTRAFAATPHLFAQRSQPRVEYLAIPAHTSERRHYLPVGYCPPTVICGNANFLVPDPDAFVFGVLSSAMFMAWMLAIGGRLKSDPRFSKSLVYNSFPLGKLASSQRQAICSAGKDVLGVRSSFEGASLADLYDRNSMPLSLLKAHRALDKCIDATFGRVEHPRHLARPKVLFKRYAELTGGDSEMFGSV